MSGHHGGPQRQTPECVSPKVLSHSIERILRRAPCLDGEERGGGGEEKRGSMAGETGSVCVKTTAEQEPKVNRCPGVFSQWFQRLSLLEHAVDLINCLLRF